MPSNQKNLSSALLFCCLLLAACGGKDLLPGKTDEETELNRCLRLSNKKHYSESIECLEIFKSRYPASANAAEAELRIADSYFRKKDYLLAAESYQQFIRLHPYHPRVDYAYYRLGLSYLNDTPSQVDRDQESLGEAIQALDVVWRSYPDSPYAQIARLKSKQAQEKAALQNFYIARFYYRSKEYRAALPRLDSIMTLYPDIDLAKKAAYLKVRSHLALAEPDFAQESLSFLEQRFPNAPQTVKARKQVAHSEKEGQKRSQFYE